MKESHTTLTLDLPSTHPTRVVPGKSSAVGVRVQVSWEQLSLLFLRQGAGRSKGLDIRDG
jgi:hypothetical protein